MGAIYSGLAGFSACGLVGLTAGGGFAGFIYIHSLMNGGEKTSGNPDIDHQDIRRLWSYNSGAGAGKYVCIKDHELDSTSYAVAATGDAEGENISTDITFHHIRDKDELKPKWFKLQFNKNDQKCYPKYYLIASESDVVAVEAHQADATSFEVIRLFPPNSAFCVLKTDKNGKHEKKKDLYLSSDGAGVMKLKVWNKPIPGPPDTNAEVDPALLFRLVRPHEKN